MTNVIYENDYSFEVSNKHSSIEVSVYDDKDVTIRTNEGSDWNSQTTNFTMTQKEANDMVIFLISKGYGINKE